MLHHAFHVSPFQQPLTVRTRTFTPVSALGYMHIPVRPFYRMLQQQAPPCINTTSGFDDIDAGKTTTLSAVAMANTALEAVLPAVTAFLCMDNAKHSTRGGIPFVDFATTFNASLGTLKQTILGGSPAGSADARAEIPFIFRADARAVVNLLQRPEARLATCDEDLRLLPPCSFLSLKLIQRGVYGDDEEQPRVYMTAVPAYPRLTAYISRGLQEILRQTGVTCVLQPPSPWQSVEMRNMQPVYLYMKLRLASVEQCEDMAARAVQALRGLFIKLYDGLLDASAITCLCLDEAVFS